MTRSDVSEIAARLGDQAEAVCRHYLPAGRREGNYWLVGDIHNTPGRSMYVRMKPNANAPPGKWTDAALGTHGDLLDIIETRCGLTEFRDVLAEARRFLAMPPPEEGASKAREPKQGSGSPQAARRLHAISEPFAGSLAEAYLRGRGITHLSGLGALRFHPRCFHRPEGGGSVETWPAMIGTVTDLKGSITGVHRTWLARDGQGKAPLENPRRSMGRLLGGGVRFGEVSEVLAAGEGLETTLSVRQALPHLPLMAALSSGHLGAILFPEGLQRLYILRDPDPAGDAAVKRLSQRAGEAGIEALVLSPAQGDFNDDLRRLGTEELRAHLLPQLRPEDREPACNRDMAVAEEPARLTSAG